jgi:transposase
MNTRGDEYLLPSREQDHRMSQAHQASGGIDGAKATCDAAVLREGKLVQRTLPMHPAGFVAVDHWSREQGVEQVHVCLQATGEDGAALALARYESGHLVSSVNPARIAASAKSRLARTKTDKTAAGLMAHCCAREQPPIWTPPFR